VVAIRHAPGLPCASTSLPLGKPIVQPSASLAWSQDNSQTDVDELRAGVEAEAER
jgi:hypothetical protein